MQKIDTSTLKTFNVVTHLLEQNKTDLEAIRELYRIKIYNN